MKKVLLLLFVYFLGFGMLSAQGMKYFEVEKTTNDNMLRLVPPDFPELVGSSGYYVENYNCDIFLIKSVLHYRIIVKKMIGIQIKKVEG